jgi:hypothetical protein
VLIVEIDWFGAQVFNDATFQGSRLLTESTAPLRTLDSSTIQDDWYCFGRKATSKFDGEDLWET